MKVILEDIGWSVESKTILDGISFSVGPGELIGLLGPNGSGKSTLLRCIYRYLEPDYGTVFVNGVDLRNVPLKESAKTMAAVLQESSSEFHVKVFEVVLMGRSPHKELLERDNDEDYKLALMALEEVGMAELAARDFNTLSGGEKQRVLLARALCQQAQVLILDEPTNHLDIRYQLEIMELVRGLNVSTIAALHDLNLAAYFCDRIIMIDKGRIVSSGTPEEVLTADLIKEVYGVTAKISIQPETDKIAISYIPSSAAREPAAAAP
jgi:iron complex transport system ATP-binding protein